MRGDYPHNPSDVKGKVEEISGFLQSHFLKTLAGRPGQLMVIFVIAFEKTRSRSLVAEKNFTPAMQRAIKNDDRNRCAAKKFFGTAGDQAILLKRDREIKEKGRTVFF
jgi:hypothetical protein